jgi:hypothetical protein
MATARASVLDPIDEELDHLLTSFDTSYAWNYGSIKQGLRDLYEKAKREQWNASADLDWSVDVDPESEIIPAAFNPLQDYKGFRNLDARGQARFRHAMLSWQLSQFMHGEQGALITASQLVGAVPWMDAKYYGGEPEHGRGATRPSVRPLPLRETRVGVAHQPPPEEARSPHPARAPGLRRDGDPALRVPGSQPGGPRPRPGVGGAVASGRGGGFSRAPSP